MRGLSIVIRCSMDPYSCRFCRMCCAYVECALLCRMYRICSWKRSFRLRLVWPTCTYASLQVLKVLPTKVFRTFSEFTLHS
jgi:hypothetical protein